MGTFYHVPVDAFANHIDFCSDQPYLKDSGYDDNSGIISKLAFNLPDVTKDAEFFKTFTALIFVNKNTSLEEVIENSDFFVNSESSFYAVGFAPNERMAIMYLIGGGNYYSRRTFTNASLYRANIKLKKLREAYDGDFRNGVDFDSLKALKSISKIKGKGKKQYLIDIDSVTGCCRVNPNSETSANFEDIYSEYIRAFCDFLCGQIFDTATNYKLQNSLRRNHGTFRESWIERFLNDESRAYNTLRNVVIPSIIPYGQTDATVSMKDSYRDARLLTKNKIILKNGMGLGDFEQILSCLVLSSMNIFDMYNYCPDIIYVNIPYMKHLYNFIYRHYCQGILGQTPDAKHKSFAEIIASRNKFYKIPEMSKEDIRMTESAFRIYVAKCTASYPGVSSNLFTEKLWMRLGKTKISVDTRGSSQGLAVTTPGGDTYCCAISDRYLQGELYVRLSDKGKYDFSMSGEIKKLMEKYFGDLPFSASGATPTRAMCPPPDSIIAAYSHMAVPVYCGDNLYVILNPYGKYRTTYSLCSDYLNVDSRNW